MGFSRFDIFRLCRIRNSRLQEENVGHIFLINCVDFTMLLNGVMLSYTCIIYVRDVTGNKQLNAKAQILAHIMQVNMLSYSANFHLNRLHSSSSFSNSKIRIESICKFIPDHLANDNRYC